jgi:hypothetical protein
MNKKQMSKLNLQRMLQNYSLSDKFETVEISDEGQIRTVSAALKKKLKETSEILVLLM